MSSHDKFHQQQESHNKRLLEALRNGYNGAPLTMDHYFFPPRPIIKKDTDALEFIHKKAKPKLALVE